MSKTTIGWLKHGDLFKFENRVYRVGRLIEGTNSYVACVDIRTHKTTRLYIDTTVEDMKGGAE